jgi:hypothetical protein
MAARALRLSEASIVLRGWRLRREMDVMLNRCKREEAAEEVRRV